jgi:UPF0176 protein
MERHDLRNLLHPDLLRQRSLNEDVDRTTLSFYRYVRLEDVEALRNALYQEWEALGVLGRIYVSQEGINAQVSCTNGTNLECLPDQSLDSSASAFRDVPWKIAVEDDGKSFLKLIIKVKKKIVADGLADDAFDVTNVGASPRRRHLQPEDGGRCIGDRHAQQLRMPDRAFRWCLPAQGRHLPRSDRGGKRTAW